MKAIHRKLLRDIWGLRGQVVAVAAVIACGVAISVMSLSTLESLRETRDTYYSRFRFAHLFASVRRAPLSIARQLSELDGVAAVEPRIVQDVTLIVEGLREPAVGRLVSIPDGEQPALNRIFLRRGRMPESGHGPEVLVGESFAVEHGFRPGDTVQAILNGRLRSLMISGVALSPEFVLQIRPGEVLPDTRRFGIFWMPRTELEAAFDMRGACNDLTVSMTHGAVRSELIRRMDVILDPWGCGGTYGRDEQVSARYLDDELRQLRGTGTIVPIVFLAVAGFLLNIVLSRLMTTQREQIAALKAFGYRRREVGAHYVQMILLITTLGILPGIAIGIRMGHGLTSMYTEFYRFPMFHFVIDRRSTCMAALVSLGAAMAGSLTVVAAAVRLPPAEAMRPEPPARYRRSLVEQPWLQRWFSQTTRMILRQLQRRPWKAAFSGLGIALATAVLVVGNFGADAIGFLIDFQFRLSQRDDLLVTFPEPVTDQVLHELQHFPGVLQTESFRVLPVRMIHGPRHRRLALTGLPANPQLFRLFDADLRPQSLPASGILMSAKLAELLDVSVGETVELEVLESQRPKTTITVSGLIQDFSGTNAWVRDDVIHRLMAETRLVNGVRLAVDPSETDALYARLRRSPGVAGVTVREAAIRSFQKTIAENQLRLRIFNILFACVIACGVVYNTARIALAERSRELATLRVLGFTTGEVSGILLGELAILTAVAIPLGMLLGWVLSWLISLTLQTEMYRIPLVIGPQTFVMAAAVVILATAASGMLVRRRIDQLDLVEVLKSHE